MTPFPLDTAPLSGVTLVEASAGTGKTWTLCELYLRLLLRHLERSEQELPPALDVREILVVTFTRAATAELRARLLGRLGKALKTLNAKEPSLATDEPWLGKLLENDTGEPDPARFLEAQKRLELARLSFDEAAVSTIHGFCQRALTEVPFSSGLPFASTLDEFSEEALENEVRDFWRRESSTMSNAFAEYLLAQGDGPERYLKFVKERLAKPLAILRFDPEPPAGEIDGEAQLATARDKLIEKLMTEVPDRLRARQRAARLFNFDTLLFDLHRALTSKDFPDLAARLRTRYPVALVDEFQDTDPLQFGILKAIYGEDAALGPGHSNSGLFLVGDPKQAIYSFRNADLHTYLGAREPADSSGRAFVQRSFGLLNNQRATPAVIRGCNRLFKKNPQAFAQPGIEFIDSAPGVANPRPLVDRSSIPRSAFQIWRVPPEPGSKGGWRNRESTLLWCAEHCADEIARLLSEADAHTLYAEGGERALQARDIAVLVRTHQQGRAVSDALRLRGIRAVAGGKDSVFQTSEADALARILQALVEPGEGFLRAALATPLLGYTAKNLDADDAALNAHRVRFAHYRADWDTRGFALIFRRLLREEGVAKRLLVQADAERRLTNLLHLGELLTEAAAVLPSRDALLRWFVMQRDESATRSDAYQLRLESDENLVKIQTIHAAKGLEFPVVFCPFEWDQLQTAGSKKQVRSYHEGTSTILDFSRDPGTVAEADARVALESAAEALRLIYVAVTRASQRCYVYSAIWADRGNPHTKLNTPLHWLLAGEEHSPERWFDNQWSKRGEEDVQAIYQKLNADIVDDDWCLTEAPPLTHQRLPPEKTTAIARARRVHQERVRGLGRISYSGMVSESPGREADYDEEVAPLAALAAAPADIPGHDFLRFPRGPSAGICVHAVLEWIDFTDPSGWEDAVRRALRENPPEGKEKGDTDWARGLMNLLPEVLAMPLPGLGPLHAVPRSDRLVELAFSLPVRALSPENLMHTLHKVGVPVERLRFEALTGYLGGVIDLLLRRDGRYYLIDWKSNHRGDVAEAYGAAGLEAEMTEHGYRLQLLMYTVAVHRFLRHRIAGYTYETHFGGAFYLFLRGMRRAWVSEEIPLPGVYHECPPFAVVDALDQLFGEEGRR